MSADMENYIKMYRVRQWKLVTTAKDIQGRYPYPR